MQASTLDKESLGNNLAESVDYTTPEQAIERADRVNAMVGKAKQKTVKNVALLHDFLAQDDQDVLTYADFEAEVSGTKTRAVVAAEPKPVEATVAAQEVGMLPSDNIDHLDAQLNEQDAYESAKSEIKNFEQNYERKHGVNPADNRKAARALKEVEAKIEALNEKGDAEVQAIRDGAKLSAREQRTTNVFSRMFRKTFNKLRSNNTDTVEQVNAPAAAEQKPTPRRRLGAMAMRLFNGRAKTSSTVTHRQPSAGHLEHVMTDEEKEASLIKS